MGAPGVGGPQGVGAIRTLIRLVPWIRPYRRAFIVMTVSACVALLMQSFIPLITGAVIDGPIQDGDLAAVWPYGGLVLLLGVTEAVLFFVRRYAMINGTLRLETKLRDDLFASLQSQSVSFHDQWPSGQLLSRATSDLSALRRFFGFGLVMLIADLLNALVVMIILLMLQWILALFVIAAMAPITFFALRFENTYRRQARTAQDLTGDLATEVEESALGIRVIKAYGRRNELLRSFMHGAKGLYSAQMTKVGTLARFWSVLDGWPQLVLAAAALGGVLAVSNHMMTVGSLVAFLALVLRMQFPVVAMGWLLALGQEAASATQRLFEVFDNTPEIREPSAPKSASGARSLRFENVHFRYSAAGDDVLRGVDLHVADGETLALVGATGSGKTTMLALVSRLYDVTDGRILIGDRDVRELSLDELRSSVGVAFEDATLFSASVRENITLGREGISDADVQQALAMAQAGFVDDLPYGLSTRIGEQGMSLSGGQRQRLALARAVVGRPSLVILDDPLSALDTHTEAKVESALRSALAQTTALVVAHRPSTVLLADRVALLGNDGRIEAVGTHQQLLASVPMYHELLAQESDLHAGETEPVQRAAQTTRARA